jgi:NAD(P)H dehydrogenase (quinone)
MNTHLKIMVAGASGHLGHRVIEILQETGYRNVVAATRNPEKLHSFSDQGIEVRKADFNEPSSLNNAFAGIDRLLLISTNDLHTLGARIRQHTNAIEAAKNAGISHIVYTSMPNPGKASDIPFAPDHIATEQALEKSGLDFTSLRVNWYADNLLGFLPQIIAAGKWPTAAGNGRIPYIPREDVAQLAAIMLVTATGKSYADISGAESLSVPEIAGIASDVFGKKIEVVDVSEKDLTNELVAIGVAQSFAPTVVMTDLNIRAGNFDVVTDLVKTATGKSPQSLRSFFMQHKNKFIN